MTPDQHGDDDILTALRMGVDYTFSLEMRALKLPVRPLAISEWIRISSDVAFEMSRMEPERRLAMSESAMMAAKVLEAASTPSIDSKEHPRLTPYVTSRMTKEELHGLFRKYVDACEALNPNLETMTIERLDALVEEAKKKSLSELTMWSREHLAGALARVLGTSLTNEE